MTTTPLSAQSKPSGLVPSPMEPLPHQLLAALAQHRMATTSQLHTLLRPHATRQTLSNPLNKLRRKGLLDYTVLPQSNRSRAWFLTPDGARLTRDWPALRGRPLPHHLGNGRLPAHPTHPHRGPLPPGLRHRRPPPR